MSRLEELIAELCPDGVEYKTLGEVCYKIQSGKNKSRESKGKYSVYGSTGLIGYSDEYSYNGQNILIARVGANCGFVNLVDGKYDVSDNTLILSVKSEYNILFAYHQLSCMNLNTLSVGAGQPLITATKLKNVKIPLPPLEVQSEIVRILDAFTELTAELTAELDARKRQYEYYRDHLFESCYEWDMVNVMDICDDVFLGLTNKVDYVNDGGVPLLRANNMTSGVLNLDDVKYISDEQHSKLTKIHKPKYGDILVSKSGTLGAVCIVDRDFEFSIYESLICLQPNKRVYNRYLLHVLRSEPMQKVMLGRKTGNAITHLNLMTFRKLYVPLPPLAEQERIVAILDRFDKLCNDISEGIPAEIEARRKQYEHYRDRLLTFKEKTA